METSLYITALLCVASAYGSPMEYSATDAPSTGPYIEIYTGAGQTGASFKLTENAHDLAVLGWDNLAKSFCAEGVWILYDNANYNMYHDPFFSWSEVSINAVRGCHEIPVTHHGKISSVRFSGTGDLHDECATLYHGYFYMGGEDLIIRDMDELGDFEDEASSMIITGQTPWTVYSEEYYEGIAICLEPWMVGDGVYVGSFEVYTIGMPNNVISSIKKGCHSKKFLASAYDSPTEYSATDVPSSGPYIEIYSGYGQTGASIKITEDAHDLAILGWDNLGKSYCAEGVWILYDNPDYNMGHDFFQSWSEVSINSARDCHEIPVTHHGKLSSVRFAGTGDLHDECVTLYHGYFYMGGEDLIIRDMDELGDFTDEASSMIITGETPWTVYAGEYYSGTAICLEPWNVGNGIYVGSFEVYTIGMPNNVISSIKKGCHAKNVLTYQTKYQ